ncbi:hypothetical protein C8J57DRAFT_1249004 [Mycena rebaudengoi]|nr:hypothetical protein C8J57DRAFT_1249004 [Mycena rebaudengoi]
MAEVERERSMTNDMLRMCGVGLRCHQRCTSRRRRTSHEFATRCAPAAWASTASAEVRACGLRRRDQFPWGLRRRHRRSACDTGIIIWVYWWRKKTRTGELNMDSRWKWDCKRRYSRGIKGGEELVGRTAHGDGRLEPQEQGGDTRMYAEFERDGKAVAGHGRDGDERKWGASGISTCVCVSAGTKRERGTSREKSSRFMDSRARKAGERRRQANSFLQADSGALSDEEDANIVQDEYNNAQDDNDDQADNDSSSDFSSRVAEDSNDEMDSSEPPTSEQAPIFAPSGSANVPSSSRMNNLPPDLGGRSSHDTAQMTASPPNQYPQSGYRTAPYGSSPTIPRLPPMPTIQAMTPVHATATRAPPGQSTDNFSNSSTPVISNLIPLAENNSGLTPMDPDPQTDEENDSGKRVRRVPRPKRSRQQAILSDDEKDCDDPDCTETGDLETITCSGPACYVFWPISSAQIIIFPVSFVLPWFEEEPTGAWYFDQTVMVSAVKMPEAGCAKKRAAVYKLFPW